MPIPLFLLNRLALVTTTQGLGAPPFFDPQALPGAVLRVTGVTKDGSGAGLGACNAFLMRTRDDFKVDQGVSDGLGNYEFRGVSPSETYYVTAYKAGAPDVAGTTVNTLVGS